ncbi:MAG TPA: FHA domain-containing protein [Acidimicrobiales bacterium]|nr:FHA domain-containing protein [Acidimicrobiales bacterium]
MTHGLLEILKYFFLVVLWLFFIYAARMVLVDARRTRGAGSRASELHEDRLDRKTPYRLRITEGEYRGETIELVGELTFGRSPSCSVSLSQDTFVSSVHARIFLQGSDAVVEDLGSTNGTYVNEARVDEPVIVDRGDRVQIGSTVLEVRH